MCSGQKGVVRTGIQKSEQFLIVMDRLRPAQELQAYPEEGDWDICHQDQLKWGELGNIPHHQMINQRYSQQNRKSQRKYEAIGSGLHVYRVIDILNYACHSQHAA